MSINDRIRVLIEMLANGKQNVFAEVTNIKIPTLNSIVGPRQSEPSFSTLRKIIDSFPSLNIIWLMKEEGMPFLEPKPKTKKSREAELNSQYKNFQKEISSSIFLPGNLRLLRKHISITQNAFGKIFGITRNMIASYEKGVKPKHSFLIDIENYFHISLDELISYDLKEHPEILKKVRIPDKGKK